MAESPPTPVKNLRFVKLSDLVIDHKHWKNPREFTGLDDKDIAELGADIKARGIQVPLNVQKIKASGGDFTNLVLEGQRRVFAANEVLPKDAEIPVIDRTIEVIDLTPEVADEIMLDILAIGVNREGLSSFELSAVAERLRSRKRTLAEIGKAIRRDESWVSKMLKARSTATPQLLNRWRKGQITDEQFKDLATIKEPEKQEEGLKDVMEARKSGDAAEARVRAKELAEDFKNGTKPNGKTNGVSHEPPPVVKGPQENLFAEKQHQPAAPKKPMTNRAMLQEIVDMAEKRRPTHDYVKGIVAGVSYALGDIGPEDFARPWAAFLARIDGSGKKPKAKAKRAKKPSKKTKKARR